MCIRGQRSWWRDTSGGFWVRSFLYKGWAYGLSNITWYEVVAMIKVGEDTGKTLLRKVKFCTLLDKAFIVDVI